MTVVVVVAVLRGMASDRFDWATSMRQACDKPLDLDHLGRHLVPVGLRKDGQMLPNYDAKAVAEVMGLAFLRGSPTGPSPAPPRRKRGAKSVSAASRPDFAIQVDGDTVVVIEAKSGISRGKGSLRPISQPSSVFIEKAVESGLPRNALRHVAEWIAGNDAAKISALERRVVPKTTLERRQARLSPHESERTERVARLLVHARRALGTEKEAREFMTSPHPELGGRSPIDATKTDLATRRTEQVLNALEFGLAL
jgi:putative toxin-antitoxin system antitoxin component (TIGR02293 family)